MLKGGVHHEDVVILFVCLGFFVCFVGFFGGLWSCGAVVVVELFRFKKEGCVFGVLSNPIVPK